MTFGLRLSRFYIIFEINITIFFSVTFVALYLRDMQVISDLLGNVLLIIVITNVSVSMLFPFVNKDLSVYILVLFVIKNLSVNILVIFVIN